MALSKVTPYGVNSFIPSGKFYPRDASMCGYLLMVSGFFRFRFPEKHLKLVTIALLSFLSLTSNAQVSNGDNQLKYIDILPPSPAVARLGEFSRPDMGMNSGTARFNLPLTKLSLGTFAVPISLNYSSNGVKVDEISSRVGIGFQLEAGGAITRSVSGKGADESTTYLKVPADTRADSRTFVNFLRDVVNSTAGQYDSEPDIFNYSFCGMSGRFLLDSADNPVQIPKTNSRIIANFNNADWTFKIVDNNGNQFYFGGTGYIEKSWKGQTCAKSYVSPTPTAWFIRKIELYNGDIITFKYLPKSYRYDLGINQTIFYTDPNQLQDVAQGGPEPDCPCPIYSDNFCINFIDVDTHYLTKISTSRGHSVSLGYTARNDSGDVLVSTITSSSETGIVESFKLSYEMVKTTSFTPQNLPLENSQNLFRYFLTAVTKFPMNSDPPVTLYKLTYNDPGGLPVRLSYAQDHWGYFNGKNNSTMIPKPVIPDLIQKFPTATANREVDTTAVKKGMLVQIRYPTGGYDSISYEPNTFYDTITVYPTIASVLTGNVTGTGFSTMVEKNLGNFTVGFGQEVDVLLVVHNLSPQTTPTHQQNGTITISNVFGGEGGTFFGAAPGTEYRQKITLQAGTYNVKVAAYGQIVKAEAFVTYFPGLAKKVSKNWHVGGLRVKQIISKSYDGRLIGRRKFSYHAFGDSQSSAVMNYDKVYHKPITFQFYCTVVWDHLRTDKCFEKKEKCRYDNMFSSSITNLFNPSGNSVSYKTVLESFDDENGNGLTEHKFIIAHDSAGQILLGNPVLGATPTNASVVNHGKEYETIFYAKSGTTYLPVKKVKNFYSKSSANYHEFTGCIVNQLYAPCIEFASGPVQPYEIAPLEATRFLVLSPFLTMDSTIVEEYTPSGDMLSNATSFVYDPIHTLLPIVVNTKDSKGNLITTSNYYSGGPAPPGTPPDQLSLLDALKARNAGSHLVYQNTSLNNSFAGSYRLLFETFTPSNLVFPKEVRTAVIGGIEATEFSILKYDIAGNILERKKKDGIVYSYIWDYNNNYPIAEVKGAYSKDVAFTSFESAGAGGWAPEIPVNIVQNPSAPAGLSTLKWGSAQAAFVKSGLDPQKTYLVSYWYEDPGPNSNVNLPSTIPSPVSSMLISGKDGWKCVTARISGTSTIKFVPGYNAVDELRLYPEGAQMTSRTLVPLVGTTSINDPNNMISYYEYDGFKRLVRARDAKGKLLSTYQYNFFKLE